MPRRSNPFARRHVRAAYRSGLERKVAEQIKDAGQTVRYEQTTLPFVQPAQKRRYTPDFILDNGIVIETKGLFTSDDRKKMEWVIEQHPDIDIRMVFTNPNAKLYKGSKTTYAKWCDDRGIPYAAKVIPDGWLTAAPNKASLAAINDLAS